MRCAMYLFVQKVLAAVMFALCFSLLFALPRAAQAVPFLITTKGLPAIDVAQRDSAGVLRLFDAADDDADGKISLVADLDPLRLVAINGKNGQVRSQLMYTVGHLNGEPLLFFVTGTEERLITRWNSPPTMPYSLGQPFSVAGGQIPGLDAVVYLNPGFASAAEIVDVDVSTLPLYGGPGQVGGLVQFQAVPEPPNFALAALGFFSLIVCECRRQFCSRS